MSTSPRHAFSEDHSPRAVEDLEDDSGARAMPSSSIFDLILQIHVTSPGGD